MEKSIYSEAYSCFITELRNARVQASLTQEQVARRLGQTQSFISKVERGERRIDIVELKAICEVLEISFPTFARQLEKTLNQGNHLVGKKA
ncbi:MAG: helix-turn-helix domain-containing protein [Pyrinomonadaceae bacterium]